MKIKIFITSSKTLENYNMCREWVKKIFKTLS